MVMIAFVEVATFDIPGTGATSILQAVLLSKPEAPVEERHTGSLLRLLRFLRSCMRRLGVHTWYSDSDGDLPDPPPTGFSPHSRKGFVEELRYSVEWSREGKPIATLAYSSPKSLHAGCCAKSV